MKVRFGIRRPSLKKRIAARTSPRRMIRSKIRVPRGYGFVTNPRKAVYNRIYSRTTRKACYIATAVYGDQDAWQVEALRQWRDKKLANSAAGRAFIRAYYAISPHLVRFFGAGTNISRWTRRLLDKLVDRII